jgi:hypothetical protein
MDNHFQQIEVHFLRKMPFLSSFDYSSHRNSKALAQHRKHKCGVGRASLTTVYNENEFTFGRQPTQKMTGKRQKKGLPICPFVTQPAFGLLKQTGFLLYPPGIRGLAQALQLAVAIVYAGLIQACHQTYGGLYI